MRRSSLLLPLALTTAGCSAPVPFVALDVGTRVDAFVGTDAASSPTDADVDAASAPMDTGTTSACGPCSGGSVCCMAPLPCAGTCVPDCRVGAGCMGGLVCSATSGVCEPAGSDAATADAAMPMMDAAMPMMDGGTMPMMDAAMPMMDGGMMPMRDTGMMMMRDAGTDAVVLVDAGSDTGVDACVRGSAPPLGAGIAEARMGQVAWTGLTAGNFTAVSGNSIAMGWQGIVNGTAGYVHVYTWNGCTTSWDDEGEIVGSAVLDSDAFGSAVALEGNLLAVGGNYRAGAAGESGVVYTFSRTAGMWSQIGMPIYPPTAAGGRFGRAVALETGSTNVLMVGGPFGKDPSSAITYTGIVSVYTRGTSGMWSYVAHLLGAESAHNDAFGYSLDLQGNTLVVGSPGAFQWGPGSTATPGKVHVFTGSGASWTQSGYLTPSDGVNSDWFGRSVARSGNVIIVGAPAHDVGTTTDAGAAYVYTLSGGVWSQTAQLVAPDGAASDFFGYTVAAVSDTRVLVGAPGADRLYSFRYAAGVWTEDTARYSTCSGNTGYALAVGSGLAVTGTPGAIFDLSDPDTLCL